MDRRGRSKVVLVATRREVLASSFCAVLEPRGYTCRLAGDLPSLELALTTDPPDVVILDEELAGLGGGLDALAPRIAQPDLPVMLYSSGAWNRLDEAPSAADFDAAWDVIEEPIRSNVLLSKLERLLELRGLWDDAPIPDGDTSGLDEIMRGLPILDSIASRNRAEIGCVVLGPTRPDAGDGEGFLSAVPTQIRGSDLCGWMGPAELVVFLYGAGIDGIGQFVSRIVDSTSARGQGELSAGIVTLAPDTAGADAPTSAPNLRVLEHVAAARRAMERAREAGGGVRVAGSP